MSSHAEDHRAVNEAQAVRVFGEVWALVGGATATPPARPGPSPTEEAFRRHLTPAQTEELENHSPITVVGKNYAWFITRTGLLYGPIMPESPLQLRGRCIHVGQRTNRRDCNCDECRSIEPSKMPYYTEAVASDVWARMLTMKLALEADDAYIHDLAG